MFSIRYILYAFLLIVSPFVGSGLQSSKESSKTYHHHRRQQQQQQSKQEVINGGTSFYRDIHNRCMANARLTRSTAKRALGGNAVDLLASSLPSPSSSSSGVGTTGFNWKKSLEVGIFDVMVLLFWLVQYL